MQDETVKVLYFAGARDAVGVGEEMLPVGTGTITVNELMDLLVARHPILGEYRGHVRLAVNCTFAGAADPVRAGDEVAIIPPVAGG
jgi:molybdopterin converting factor subunit 1